MSEEPAEYHTGRTTRAEPPFTVDALVAKAHANRQAIPYDSRGVLLQKLPDLLRALADHALGGKAQTSDVAYAVAALIDSIENAPAESDRLFRHQH